MPERLEMELPEPPEGRADSALRDLRVAPEVLEQMGLRAWAEKTALLAERVGLGGSEAPGQREETEETERRAQMAVRAPEERMAWRAGTALPAAMGPAAPMGRLAKRVPMESVAMTGELASRWEGMRNWSIPELSMAVLVVSAGSVVPVVSAVRVARAESVALAVVAGAAVLVVLADPGQVVRPEEMVVPVVWEAWEAWAGRAAWVASAAMEEPEAWAATEVRVEPAATAASVGGVEAEEPAAMAGEAETVWEEMAGLVETHGTAVMAEMRSWDRDSMEEMAATEDEEGTEAMAETGERLAMEGAVVREGLRVTAVLAETAVSEARVASAAPAASEGGEATAESEQSAESEGSEGQVVPEEMVPKAGMVELVETVPMGALEETVDSAGPVETVAMAETVETAETAAKEVKVAPR